MAAADSAAFVDVGSAASAVVGPVAAATSSLAKNANVVGPAWVVSSAIFTTFATTSFLKYSSSPRKKADNFEGRLKDEITKKGSEMVNIEAVSSISRPALLTLYRFSGSLLMGLVLHSPVLQVVHRARQTYEAIPHFAVPAAFLFVANYCNSIALDRIGISLTYTSKCGIPLITVLMTLFLDGMKALPSVPALISLVPIALGIAAASWNHPTFEAIGFAAAIISCSAQAALNVSSKKVMTMTKVTGPDAQRTMVAVALVITVAMSVINHVRHVTREEPALEGERTKMIYMEKSTPSASSIRRRPPLWLSLAAVVSYHVEYVLSFMFVKLVQPITYGTCDAIRRLAIIVSGHHMFGGEPFTKLNICGIGLALMGALSYAFSNR
uniref:Sugar phosphate transporter domain-containing protein n=1 Tax=Odontella aurita TaxID=265563 RepID=A0A7S4JMM6_9STRA|mmetsp:Transcript_49134/g.147918  ORF Transcript_49134/g.147918 Transcript_49134/m.147918 type:complete len:382 (+) Transcript_49134:195-1340(+)